MSNDNIKGQFSGKPFDALALEAFVEQLKEAGFPAQAEWKKGKRNTSPAQANVLTLKIGDDIVFTHGPRGGHINTAPLTAQQKTCLLDALRRSGFVREPSLNLAIWLAIGYCVLHLGLILLRIEEMRHAYGFDRGDARVILVLQAVGFAAAVIGTLLVLARERPAEKLADFILPGVFLIPGFLLTVPSALMLLPAVLYKTRQHIHDAIAETTGALDSPQSETV